MALGPLCVMWLCTRPQVVPHVLCLDVRRASSREWHLLGPEYGLVFLSPPQPDCTDKWEWSVQRPNGGNLGRASCRYEGLACLLISSPGTFKANLIERFLYKFPKSRNWNCIVLGGVPSGMKSRAWHAPGAVKTHIFLEMPPSPTSAIGTSGCVLTFSQMGRRSPGS